MWVAVKSGTLRSRMSVLLGFFIVLLCAAASGGEPEGGTTTGSFAEILDRAKTSVQLESLLVDYPDRFSDIVPRLEAALVDDIRREGAGTRYVIKQIEPWEYAEGGEMDLPAPLIDGKIELGRSQGGQVLGLLGQWRVKQIGGTCYLQWVIRAGAFRPFASVTLTGMESGSAVATLEFPGDRVLKISPYEGNEDDMFHVWLADGSIHRFVGKVRIGRETGCTIVGEGGIAQRLTFALLKGVGYVYLRGRGKVILGSGGEIALGDAAKQPHGADADPDKGAT